MINHVLTKKIVLVQIVALTLAAISVVGPVSGATLDLRPTADTYVSSAAPSVNFSCSDELRAMSLRDWDPVSQTEIFSDEVSLLKFPTDRIPEGATIDAAYLYLNQTAAPYHTEVSVTLLENWWEPSTVSWATRPWVEIAPPNFWTGLDFGTKVYNERGINVNHAPGWHRFDLTPTVVQWANGTLPDFGVAISTTDRDDPGMPEDPPSRIFSSSCTLEYDPILKVIYDAERVVVPLAEDACVVPSAPNANFGGNNFLKIGGGYGGQYEASYVKVDLPALDPADLELAILNLNQTAGSGARGHLAAARAVLEGWSEGTITFNTQPRRDPNVLSYRGAMGDVFDLGWHDWDITSAVSAWASGELVNNGIAVEPLVNRPQGPSRLGTFTSRESATQQPYVELFMIPEPATLVLMVTGGLFIALARRRFPYRAS